MSNMNNMNRVDNIDVRIVRDEQNRDGWTARTLSTSTLCFIQNIGAVITQLEPGQVWESDIMEAKDKYCVISLTHKIKD